MERKKWSQDVNEWNCCVRTCRERLVNMFHGPLISTPSSLRKFLRVTQLLLFDLDNVLQHTRG
jgi:hypothetical protein